MTRRRGAGAHRNLIGLKVSDDLLAAITAARQEARIQDFLRGLIASALERPAGWTDWERRAREAEERLERVRAALKGGP